MAILSCWGEVTTENEQEVIAANRKIHPQLEKLLSVLSDILNSAKIEYWIDQGTLLGAYRHGKFITRDSDIDIAIKNEEQFDSLSELLKSKLPNIYASERKESHCRGYRIWLKTGGTFKGTFEGREIQWPLVCFGKLYVSSKIGLGANSSLNSLLIYNSCNCRPSLNRSTLSIPFEGSSSLE